MKLPVNTVEKLKILKDLYEEDWGTAASYDQIIERLLGSGSLGALDPGIYRRFSAIVDSRDDFEDIVKKSTSAAVDELAARAEANGTSLAAEAKAEQESVKASLKGERKEARVENFPEEWEDIDPLAE